MGKKKRPAGPAQIPLFYAKKRKLNEATQLTALVALHKYCAKFKLGAPGFRPLTTAPHHEVCVVMDGAELGRARHADRAGAMERAALLTLNLLDPEAKSLPANVAWPDAAAVRALQLAVIGAKHDAPARLGSRSATTADTSATLPEHVLDASAIDRAGTIVSAEYGCVVRSILSAGVRVRVGRG